MSLKIVRASEPIVVKNLVLCVYGQPGLGKTSLAFTAEAALLLDFDAGAYRSGNRGDSTQVGSWSDVASISAADLAGVKTLIIDTAGRALDSLTADIIAANPKMGRGGALTLPGYGELKARFIAFTKLIRSFGLDIVLVAHSDEQRNGDEVTERIDMQGGSKGEVYKLADVMGRLALRGGKRALNFNPTDTAFGKNPAGLAELAVPDFASEPRFLAGVIAQTKAALNKQTAGQAEVAKELAAWQDRFEQVGTAAAMNALVPLVQKEASEAVRDNVKRLWLKVGMAKGFEFDREAKAFRVAAPAPVAEPDQDEIQWPEAVPA